MSIFEFKVLKMGVWFEKIVFHKSMILPLPIVSDYE